MPQNRAAEKQPKARNVVMFFTGLVADIFNIPPQYPSVNSLYLPKKKEELLLLIIFKKISQILRQVVDGDFFEVAVLNDGFR